MIPKFDVRLVWAVSTCMPRSVGGILSEKRQAFVSTRLFCATAPMEDDNSAKIRRAKNCELVHHVRFANI